jgi:alkanesulfonate monooxygenase SsuD/methylene tetrahydromethanopterin reductase-like flavin-dependent oxidoreductase (luciferase family)
VDLSRSARTDVRAQARADARAQAARAWARLTDAPAGLPDRLFVAGGPSDVVDELHRYWELGCTEFVLGPAKQGDRYLEQVDLLARHVLPEVKQFS